MVQIICKSLITGTCREREDQIETVQDEKASGEKSEPTDPVISRRKDRGKWPSLYEECQHMLASSVMMYAVADLRNQIRMGKIVDPSIAEPFMRLPARTEELVPIVLKNKHFFNRLLGQEPNEMVDKNDAYLDTLIATRDLGKEGIDIPQQSPALLEIHDENNDREIVYAITLNPTREWIEITFRGSVTSRDFAVDADPFMNWYPNPVGSIRGHPQDKAIGIHAGFAYYMNQSSSALVAGKTQKILDSVRALQKEYPHYRIYLTGHSLGGALSTLTAFTMACIDDINKPVTCVSVASPKVGNNGFMRAFQALEKMGKLRCARVVNFLDVIPAMPTRVCWCADVCCCCCSFLCCGLVQTTRYWNVGVKILLKGDGGCDISYEREVLTYTEQLRHEASLRGSVCRLIRQLIKGGDCGKGQGDFVKNHSCKEYIERVDAVKEQLRARSLEEFYARQSRRSIVSLRRVSMSQLSQDL